MPGIFGIIGRDSPEKNGVLFHQMPECMMHESFYRSNNYINESLGFWIGWVSHKSSFSDCNPIWNETNDICLIFSGEDFIDSFEITNLRSRGHQFEPKVANYLVHLYEEKGLDFIEQINGWFCGILVDLRKEIAVLFNDRYGLGRIYYCQTDSSFCFSSEAKSLLKVFPQLRKLDIRSLAETFSCGCALQNRTLFSGISLLPGGSRWVFHKNGNFSATKYFMPDHWEKQSILGCKDFYDQLKATFNRILPKYLQGEERLAMSLTGGLDGRMIMAWANYTPENLPCYSFGSLYRDCADVKIARRVAKACGQPHRTIEVGQQFLKEFPSLAERAVYISDGAMDVSGSVELYVNKLASQIAQIRLTGNYGSEILRGNVAFKPRNYRDSLLEPEFAEWVRKAVKTYHDESKCHKLSFIAFKQVPWHHYSRLSVEQSQLIVRSPYLDNAIVRLMYRAPKDFITNKQIILQLISDGNIDLARIPTDRGLIYKSNLLINDIQKLYNELTVKAEYAYDYGMPQWLVRVDDFFSPFYLERLFLGRHKFYHFRIWYKNNLSEYIKDTLLNQKARERCCYRSNSLEKIINAHLKGYGNYTLEIHRALTLELIYKCLIDHT